MGKISEHITVVINGFITLKSRKNLLLKEILRIVGSEGVEQGVGICLLNCTVLLLLDRWIRKRG